MPCSTYAMQKGVGILVLALAVEVLYMVPYGLTSSFRPMFRESFQLTNEDVAKMASAYGIMNMCLYLPGGYIADRIQPRILLPAALLTTAVCCCYIARLPSVTDLIMIWAVLAFAGGFLFWPAFVATIREIGDGQHTGKAFGFEQFSRGLVGTLLVLGEAAWIERKEAGSTATTQEKTEVMVKLLKRLAVLQVATALLVYLVVPSRKIQHNHEHVLQTASSDSTGAHAGLFVLAKRLCIPAIWLHALIVVSAYSCNLATGYFAGLATSIYGMSDVQAARMSTMVTTMRALLGFPSGVAADRFGRAKMCFCFFVICVCAYAWVALTPAGQGTTGPTVILIFQISICAASAYGIAAVYFTLLDEARLPLEVTGSAVGLISIVGFTPDIFLGQIAAYCFDRSPVGRGYMLFYSCVAGIGAVGLFSTLLFAHVVQSPICDSPQLPTADSSESSRPSSSKAVYGSTSELAKLVSEDAPLNVEPDATNAVSSVQTNEKLRVRRCK